MLFHIHYLKHRSIYKIFKEDHCYIVTYSASAVGYINLSTQQEA
jgi:hypothetical protein